MAPSRMLAAAVLSAALVVPATAGAAERAAESPRPAASSSAAPKAPGPLRVAAAVARRHWGAVPCNGQIKMRARRPPAAGVDPTSDAWVTFDTPLGVNNLAAAASSYTDCTITFGHRRWPTSASMRQDWDMLCTTMIHELGHLLGHSHDSAYGSVMAPVFTDRSSVPAICPATRPGALNR